LSESKFQPPNRQSLSERIAKEILSLIRRGELKPGDKLPPERDLAKRFQVSRTAIRESLSSLAFMNVIRTTQGDGTYISDLEAEGLSEHLGMIFSARKRTILNLFEARKIVEVACAGLSAERINSDEINEMHEVLDKYLEGAMRGEPFRESDHDLHRHIAKTSKNPILADFLISIEALTLESRKQTSALPGIREAATKQHEEIVTAIANRDPDAAREAMYTHLSFIENAYRESFHDEDI
jgi:GntR family transcriptional repressor for pyruvate dehydrogenase complex